MRSWRIGSAFGIGLYIHWSFLLLPAFIGWYNLRNGGPEAALLAVVLIFALFACVILHEFGHALMARAYGIDTRDITMYPIGGIARLERMSERPVEELMIAIAGPLVNVVIAAGLLVVMVLSGTLRALDVPASAGFGDVLVLELWKMNIALVLFNMLPAFPMDGGRMLRAILAMWLDRLQATRVAVAVGSVFAVLFVVGAFFNQQPFLGLIGVLVPFLGFSELAMLHRKAQARRFGRGETMTVLPVDHIAPTARPFDPQFSGFTWDGRHGLWVEWRNGVPVGASSVGHDGAAG